MLLVICESLLFSQPVLIGGFFWERLFPHLLPLGDCMPQKTSYFSKQMEAFIRDFQLSNNLSFAGAVKRLINIAQHSVSREEYQQALDAIDIYRDKLTKYSAIAEEVKKV